VLTFVSFVQAPFLGEGLTSGLECLKHLHGLEVLLNIKEEGKSLAAKYVILDTQRYLVQDGILFSGEVFFL